jgi:uncharacterized protein YkwD
MFKRFFYGQRVMKVKIKIILLISAAAVLLVVVASSLAFMGRVTGFNSSFTCASNYKVEQVAKATIIKSRSNLEDESKEYIKDVLVHLNDNLDQKVEEIHSKYIAEVKAAANTATTIKAAPQTALEATPVNLNDLEAAILNIINTIRVSNGLGALSPNQTLTDLARLRSQDMITRNYFSHYTPDGKNIKHIFAEYGVTYINFGENLGRSNPASSGTPEAFGNAWMNSPSHRDNMLKEYYRLIGVGVIDGGGIRVVTVLFIR